MLFRKLKINGYHSTEIANQNKKALNRYLRIVQCLFTSLNEIIPVCSIRHIAYLFREEEVRR